MKNTILLGNYEENGLLCQVLERRELLSDNISYQIVERPGGGFHARRLNPLLKHLSAEEAIGTGERFVVFNEDVLKLLSSLPENAEVIRFPEPRKDSPCDEALPVYELRFRLEYLPDLLHSVDRLSLMGYRFTLRSDSKELDTIFQFFTFKEGKKDFCIRLIGDTSMLMPVSETEKRLFSFAERSLKRMDMLYRASNLYQKEDWESCYEDLEDGLLYLPLSRQVRQLKRSEKEILGTLKGTRAISSVNASRKEIQGIIAMFRYERIKSLELEALLRTRKVEIVNLDDVIVSYLGSRKCNLGCLYCFSDHRSAKKAVMTDNEFQTVLDIVIEERPEARFHIDNNLGGEPCLDRDNVMKRHNCAISYHKLTGIESSFGLLTNGTEMTKEFQEWLRTHLPYLGFSLDGDRDTNDRIRKDASGNPTYDRTVKTIRRIQKSDWPVDTGISMVLSRYNTNVSSLERHMREELGIRNIVMKPVRASQDSDFALTYQDMDRLEEAYREFFQEMLLLGRKGDFRSFYAMLQPIDYAGRFLLRTFWGDRLVVKRCGCGEHIFSVSDDGTIYPCDSFNGIEDQKLGDIHEGMRKGRQPKSPFVTEEIPELNCSKCWCRYLCGGVCQYVHYLNNYKYNDVIRMECSFARFLIKESLIFWYNARREWDPRCWEEISEHIRNIGVPSVCSLLQ